MRSSALPPVEVHHPATFHSRGVAAPFTTPLLAGTRVRRSERSGIELVVPNPSGGRGVCIVHWPGVRALCNPTVHDTVLFQRLSHLQRIDPAGVRDAAQQIALAGYAGRDAIAAAETARDSDHRHRLLTHFLLLAELTEQMEPTGRTPTALAERTPEFDNRAGVLLRRIAPSLGCTAEHLTAGVAAMGSAFAPIGIGWDDRTARVPRLITILKETHADLTRWLTTGPENDIGGLGRTMSIAMRGICEGSEAVLENTRNALTDPMTLIRRWIARPDEPQALALRCEWLLDGWERICLIWKLAGSLASRRAALLEMALLLPALPREVNAWINFNFPSEATDEACRVVSNNDSWRRGGAGLTLIQRNESLRAMGC